MLSNKKAALRQQGSQNKKGETALFLSPTGVSWQESFAGTNSDILQQFEARLQEAGLVLHGGIQADGQLHRCGTADKPKGKDGAYRIHLDAPASAWWQNWRTGESGTWTAKADRDMTDAERQALRRCVEEDKAARQAEQELRWADVARLAASIWDAAPPATDEHPYLVKKQVPSLGLRQAKDGRLIAPVLGESGKVQSLQFIAGDGGKLFLSGGKTAGGFFSIPAKDGGKTGPLVIAEGYATAASVHLATGYACLVAFNAGNLEAVATMARAKHPKREIVMAADNDVLTDGNPGVTKATAAAQAIGGKLAICPAHEGKPTDFNDLRHWRSLEAVRVVVEAAQTTSLPEPPPMPEQGAETRLNCVTAHEFLSLHFPERKMLLSPVLPRQGLCMLHAQRGVGKTFISLSAAYAVASGGKIFGCWEAPEAARVLLIDGEMPARALQDRLAAIVVGSQGEPPDNSFLRILTPDMQDGPMPNLATSEGQAAVEPLLKDVDLIVLDNLATLARHGRANDEESWLPVQGWLLGLRRRGMSALLVHHQGKGGDQRGTSAKEDVLDTVISLKRPQDYRSEEGARFEVHLTKARGICGPEANPFEAQLYQDGDALYWTTREIEDSRAEQLRTLLAEGFTLRDAAEEMGISKSAAGRLKKRMDSL